MSSSVLFVGVICALVAVNMANVGQRYIGHAVNADYPGQCYYNDEKVAIKVGGSHFSKKECVEIECQDEFVLHFKQCPAYGNVSADCAKTEDVNALYPKCCPTFKCPQ